MLEPGLLLADEVTGNLDKVTGAGIHDLLVRINEERKITLIVVTHNLDLAEKLGRVTRLSGICDQNTPIIQVDATSALPGARVFAFEPESQNYALLCKNIVQNSLSERVVAFSAALSDEEKFDKIHLSDFRVGGSCHSFGEAVDFNLQKTSFKFVQGCYSTTIDKLVARWQRNWGHNAEILGVTAPSLLDDERARRWFTRYQRLAMPPGASVAMYRWVLSVDVREVLANISAPTLVLHRRDAYHHRVDFGRYLAEHIPGAQLVELEGDPGAGVHSALRGIGLMTASRSHMASDPVPPGGTPSPPTERPGSTILLIACNTGASAAGSRLLVRLSMEWPGRTVVGFSTNTTKGGTVTWLSNGVLRYTPAPNYVGKDLFAYTVRDSTGLKTRDLVHVEVVNRNLEAHYAFEEVSGKTAADSTGNGHPGKLQGATDFSTSSEPGVSGQGLRVDSGGVICDNSPLMPPDAPVNKLIGCISSDRKWLVATAWDHTQELFQGIITCIHADFRIGGLGPKETKRLRRLVYIMPNDFKALLKRYRADFPVK